MMENACVCVCVWERGNDSEYEPKWKWMNEYCASAVVVIVIIKKLKTNNMNNNNNRDDDEEWYQQTSVRINWIEKNWIRWIHWKVSCKKKNVMYASNEIAFFSSKWKWNQNRISVFFFNFDINSLFFITTAFSSFQIKQEKNWYRVANGNMEIIKIKEKLNYLILIV